MMIPRIGTSLQRVLPLAGALSVLVLGLWAWPYTVDDAYIIGRYARNLASGLGYSLDGQVASDGVTGPLWLLPGYLAGLVGVDPVVAAKTVGLACMALALALVLQRLAARSLGRATSVVGLLLVVAQPTAGTWGVAGLETGAATLALCVAALAATRRPRPALVTSGLALGVLAWLRPELALSAAVLLGALWLRWRKRTLCALSTAAGLALALVVLRWLLFGSPVPLSFYAKAGTFSEGVRHTGLAALLLTGGFGSVLFAAGATRGRRDDRLFACLVLAQALAVSLVGGDWMPGFRLFAPILPLYISVASVGAVRLASTPIGKLMALVALCFACGLPALDLVTRIPDVRAAGASRERAGHAIAERLHAEASLVALVDIGYLGYQSSVRIMDLAGITDAEVAHLPGGHLSKHIDDDLLVRRAPSAFLLHSSSAPRVDAQGRLTELAGYPVEMRVAASHFLRSHFRVAEVFRYAPRYYYALLLPEQKASLIPPKQPSALW